MTRRKIILNAPEATHAAVKVAAALKGRSINEVCLLAIESDSTVKDALCAINHCKGGATSNARSYRL